MKECRSRQRRSAFTLIEMLVVIAVIGIMAGIVFRMMSRASQSAMKAQTTGTLEQLANALTEFKAEYGQYPPVVAKAYPPRMPPEKQDFDWDEGVDREAQLVKYEFENTAPGSQHASLNDYFNKPGDWPNDEDIQNEPFLFRKGLLSFLLPRDPQKWPKDVLWSDGHGWYNVTVVHTNSKPRRIHGWIGDTERDLHAKLRWAPMLKDILHAGYYEYPRIANSLPYGQAYVRVHDAWDRSILYESKPPYQSYKLWSRGPSSSDPDDDIHVGVLDR